MPKSNQTTFGKLPFNALFVTGPASTLFVKVDKRNRPYDCIGGAAILLETEEETWLPASRLVTFPTKKHFAFLAKQYAWNKLK